MPFFKNCDTSFLVVMVPRIHGEYAWWGKIIVSEGAHSMGLCMISRGFTRTSVHGALSGLLTTNDFFGEESLLSDQASPTTVTTITQCQYMVLEREHFEELLDLYPQVRRALTRYTDVKQKARDKRNRAAIADQTQQLRKVRYEAQRVQHMLPSDSRQRLAREIAAFEAVIREQYQSTRRSSPGFDRIFASLRRSSCPGAPTTLRGYHEQPGQRAQPRHRPPRSLATLSLPTLRLPTFGRQHRRGEHPLPVMSGKAIPTPDSGNASAGCSAVEHVVEVHLSDADGDPQGQAGGEELLRSTSSFASPGGPPLQRVSTSL